MESATAIGLKTFVACTAFALFLSGCDDEDEELRELVVSGACPGYVTFLFEPGREEWKCFGWADRETGRQIDEQTVFRVCSMTKSFVGALAAVLADRGDLDLDDRISRTFPEFSGEKSAITLRQCLSMTAGFAEMSPTMTARRTFSQDPASVAKEMAGVPLAATPGSKFIYSNPSFEIAAAVIERTVNRPLEAQLEETFFHPLGMEDTTFFPTKEMRRRLATVYQLHEDGPCSRKEGPLIVELPPEGKRGCASASGGLYSTPYDIAKFYEMLLRGGRAEDGTCVMSAGALALIASKQTPSTVAEKYTLGFFYDGRWFGHAGAYGTVAECDLEKGCMRMLFSQVAGRPAYCFIRKWKRQAEESYSDVALTCGRWNDATTGGSCEGPSSAD